MKTLSLILASAFFCVCSADVVMRIKVKDQADYEKAMGLAQKFNGTEWGRGHGFMEVQVADEAAPILSKQMDARTVIENANEKIAKSMEENKQARRHAKRLRASASAILNYYAPYGDIEAWLGQLAAQNNFVTLQTIGQTLQGRNMKLVKIGLPGSNKKAIFITGGFHAREWLGIASTIYTIHRLVTDAKRGDQRVGDLLKRYDFYIIPVSNPDGYVHTFKGGRARMWRKTMKHIRGDCYGVDPNRNFDVDFGRVGVSKNPCRDDYPGTRPFSEIEVRNIKTFGESLRGKMVLYFDVHAYSQMVLLPLAYDHRKSFPNQAEIKRVGTLMKNAIKGVNNRKYVMGAPGDLLYDASGSSFDWFMLKNGVKYVYGFEVYPPQKSTRNGFIAIQPADIKTTGKEISEAILVAAENIRV